MKTNDSETAPEKFGPSLREPAKALPQKRAYQSPCITEWGSILELTSGEGFDIADGDFTGSGGT
jgi:hypothetical protein